MVLKELGITAWFW